MAQASPVYSYNALFAEILKQNIALNGEKGIAGFSLFNGPTGLGKTSSLYSAHDDLAALPILQEIKNRGKKAIFITHRWNIILDLYHNLTQAAPTNDPNGDHNDQGKLLPNFKATLLYPQQQLLTHVICNLPLPHEKEEDSPMPTYLSKQKINAATKRVFKAIRNLKLQKAITQKTAEKWLSYCQKIYYNYEPYQESAQPPSEKQEQLTRVCSLFEQSLIKTLLESDEDSQKILRKNPLIQQLLPGICFQDQKHDLLIMTTQKFFYGFYDGVQQQRFSQKSLRDYVIFIDEFDYQSDVLQKLLSTDFPIQNMMECIGQLLVDSKEILDRSMPYHREASQRLINLSEQFATALDQANIPPLTANRRNLLIPKSLSQKTDAFEMRYLFRADQLISNAYLSLINEEDTLVLYPHKELIPSTSQKIPLYHFMRILENYLSRFIRELHYIDEKYGKKAPYPVPLSQRIIKDLLNEKNDGKESYYARVLPYLYPYLQVAMNLPELKRIGLNGQIPKTYENLTGFTTWAIDNDNNAFDLRRLNIKRASMQTTPDGILLDLASRNLIIALSATAYIPRVISNFDLPWLMQVLPYIAELRTPNLSTDSFGYKIPDKEKALYLKSPIPYFDNQEMIQLQKTMIQSLIDKKRGYRSSRGLLFITEFNGKPIKKSTHINTRLQTQFEKEAHNDYAQDPLFPNFIPSETLSLPQSAHLEWESIFYHTLPAEILSDQERYNPFAEMTSLNSTSLDSIYRRNRSKESKVSKTYQFRQALFSKQLELLKIASYKEMHLGQIAFCNSFRALYHWFKHPDRPISQQYLPWLKIFSIDHNHPAIPMENSPAIEPDLFSDLSLSPSKQMIPVALNPYQRWRQAIAELNLDKGATEKALSNYLYYLEVNNRPLILWFLNAKVQKLPHFQRYYRELFRCNIPILLMTQANSSSNGINFHFEDSSGKTQDLSIIYLLEEHHYFFSKKENFFDGMGNISEGVMPYDQQQNLLYKIKEDPAIKMIRDLQKLFQNRFIQKSQLAQNIAQILGDRSLTDLNKTYKKSEDYLLNIMANLQQQIGRLERVWNFSQNIEIYANESLAENIADFTATYCYQNNADLISQLNREIIDQAIQYQKNNQLESHIEMLLTEEQSGESIRYVVESLFISLLQELRHQENLEDLEIVKRAWQQLGIAVLQHNYQWCMEDEAIRYKGNHPKIRELLSHLKMKLSQWACFKLPQVEREDLLKMPHSTDSHYLTKRLQYIWYTQKPWKFFTSPGRGRYHYDLDQSYDILNRHSKILFQFRAQGFLNTLLPTQAQQYEYALHPHILQRIFKGRAGEYAVKALFDSCHIETTFEPLSAQTYEEYDLTIVGTPFRIDVKFWSPGYMRETNHEHSLWENKRATETNSNHSNQDQQIDEPQYLGEISTAESTTLYPDKLREKLARIRKHEGSEIKLILINLFDPHAPGTLLGYNADFMEALPPLKADIILLNSALHHQEKEQLSPGFLHLIEILQSQYSPLKSYENWNDLDNSDTPDNTDEADDNPTPASHLPL